MGVTALLGGHKVIRNRFEKLDNMKTCDRSSEFFRFVVFFKYVLSPVCVFVSGRIFFGFGKAV